MEHGRYVEKMMDKIGFLLIF